MRAAAPAPSFSRSSADALASWKSALLAHINSFKRYPPGASGAGAVSVAFRIDGAGVVMSVRLIASSGDRVLDAEAVALIHRASPMPPPPVARPLALDVPIRFNRQ